MPYKQILEEGLKEFDEKFPNKIAEVIDDFGSSCKPKFKSFLTTFAEKIREGMVEEVEKLRKDSDNFVPFQKIHYQSALDDLLAKLTNNKK